MPAYVSPAVLSAFSILESIDAAGEIGVTELARRLRLRKSSTFRLLNTLAYAGYVAKNPDTDRYRLTPQAAALGAAVGGSMGVRRAAAPVMARLAARTGENVNLGILRGGRVHNTHKADGGHQLRLHIDAPRGVVAHATALGKVLLAALPIEECRRRLGARLSRLTPSTIGSWADLRAELEQVARQGYAVDNEECSIGVRAVAAPILDRHGRVIASMSVAGPSQRLTARRMSQLAQAMKSAAAEVSRRLGHKGGRPDRKVAPGHQTPVRRRRAGFPSRPKRGQEATS